jgi:Flp pilus assembly protein TadB
VAERASTFRTGGAGWWLTLGVAIGAAAALVGIALHLEILWVAIAAGAVAAVLPAYLDRRKRRRGAARRRAVRPPSASAQRPQLRS